MKHQTEKQTVMGEGTVLRGWHVAKTGNHQGLIIDDNTGETIAVAYEKDNAPLLAAAPRLLAACKLAYEHPIAESTFNALAEAIAGAEQQEAQ